MNENSLNNKLNRIDETLLVMKNNLGLSENEVIENLATATNLHTLANIFIQEDEPIIKDGIWIQANTENHPYDKIKIGGDIVIPGAWRNDLGHYTNPLFIGSNPYNPCQRSVVLNNYLYLIEGQLLYKIDLNNGNVLSTLRIATRNLNHIQVFNNKIYISVSDYNIYLYDENTNTATVCVTGLSNLPGAFCVMPDGDTIYTYTSRNGAIYKHSVKEGTTTQVWSSFYNQGFYFMLPLNNTQILALGIKKDNYLFNIETNTYQYLSSLNCFFAYKDFSAWTLGDKLYIAGFVDDIVSGTPVTKGVFEIDLIELTYKDISNQFDFSSFSGLRGIVLKENTYYAINNVKGTGIYITPQDSTSAEYDNNLIIIFQTPITKSEKQTALWTYPCLEGRMCQSFFDVYYYNKETGFNFTLPIYYGNGEKWIKFKN